MGAGMMFQVGDVVRLKSGGLQMTIVDEPLEGRSTFRCVWIDEQGNTRAHYFEPDVLDLCRATVRPAPSGPHVDVIA